MSYTNTRFKLITPYVTTTYPKTSDTISTRICVRYVPETYGPLLRVHVLDNESAQVPERPHHFSKPTQTRLVTTSRQSPNNLTSIFQIKDSIGPRDQQDVRLLSDMSTGRVRLRSSKLQVGHSHSHHPIICPQSGIRRIRSIRI